MVTVPGIAAFSFAFSLLDGGLQAAVPSERRPEMCRIPEKAAPPPFPLRTVGLLLFITLSDSIVITFLMPMVPYMVRNYGVAEEDVGFSAGSLASAYNIAGLFSGFFWGRVSDTYGRRPVLLFGLLSTGATVVWFGLAGTRATPPNSTLTNPFAPARAAGPAVTTRPAVIARPATCRSVAPHRQPLVGHHRTGRRRPAKLQPGSYSRDAARGHVGGAPRARLRLGRAGAAASATLFSLSPPTKPRASPSPSPRARPRTRTLTVTRRGASVSSLVRWSVGCYRAPPTRCPSCAARSSIPLRIRRPYPNH